mmetsp:Transcript_10354/g.47506  ORF Transcript_10354/g.47506 Transcript_10354/m.47506 type:complete len:202 (+) Transcript_10354:250-855(+)
MDMSANEFTFWPSSVTSLTPSSESRLISFKMDPTGLDRSLPRVNGTMQKAHMLLHPRMMDTNAEGPAFGLRTGAMSAYVSSSDSCVLMAAPRSPPSSPLAASMSLGRSLYASGPATRSARPSASSSFSLSLSPMHPSIPTTGAGLASLSPFLDALFHSISRSRFTALSCRSLAQILASAPSRMAHVLTRMASASSCVSVRS